MANFVFPVTDVAAAPPEFTAWAPRAADPLRLPPATIDEQRDAWIESWRELME